MHSCGAVGPGAKKRALAQSAANYFIESPHPPTEPNSSPSAAGVLAVLAAVPAVLAAVMAVLEGDLNVLARLI